MSSDLVNQTLIREDKLSYLFIAIDDSNIYRETIQIKDFQKRFYPSSEILLNNLFENLLEAVQACKVEGQSHYIVLDEAIGKKGSCFRYLTASSLSGVRIEQPESGDNCFAGNVTSGAH